MPDSGSKPLLTFAVFALNQEPFIREAVQAAFAQDYSPLEIVLSDDRSEDRTFEIMQEMARAYRGPHRVIVNQNPSRLSIGGHVNAVMRLSKGELVVSAAGDDISRPNRTRSIYEAWEAGGRRATSIHSGFDQIDAEGRPIRQIYSSEWEGETRRFVEQHPEPLPYVQTLKPYVYGCTHAWSRELMRQFGDVPDEIIHEDNTLVFRSILKGQVVYVNEVLVSYRLHGANVFLRDGRRPPMTLASLGRDEDRIRRGFRNREAMFRSFLLDLATAKSRGFIAASAAEPVQAEAERRLRHYRLMGEFLESGSLRKWRLLETLKRDGVSPEECRVLSKRLLPRSVFLRLRWLRGAAAGLARSQG
ncbi:MAG: glycosyltransferase [Verrucomicrobiota bacterium]